MIESDGFAGNYRAKGTRLALKLKEQATCVVLLFKFELLINISLGVTF